MYEGGLAGFRVGTRRNRGTYDWLVARFVREIRVAVCGFALFEHRQLLPASYGQSLVLNLKHFLEFLRA
jgi:hypothetical protein